MYLMPHPQSGHLIQVAHDSLRVIVTEIDLAIRGLNSYHLVSPGVGTRVADATNSISSRKTPGLDRITHYRLLRNRTQPDPQRRDLNSVAQEPVAKPAPHHGQHATANDQHHDQTKHSRSPRIESHRDGWPDDGWQNQQTPHPARMSFLGQQIALINSFSHGCTPLRPEPPYSLLISSHGRT